MRQHGKRARRAASGLALIAVAALAAAGIQACTSSPASTTQGTGGSAGGSSTAGPGLTRDDAQSAFRSYVTVSNLAARTGDRARALSVLSDVAWDTMSAQFTIAQESRIRPPYTQYAYGAPAFYLLAPSAGYPQYFVVSVARTPVPGTAPMTPSSQDVAAGVPLPGAGRVLMLFEKSAAGGAWDLASVSQLEPGQAMPALATGSDGSVIAEHFSAPSSAVLVRPALAPPLQATVVDDGPASAASQVVASGPLTTGLYQAAASSARGFATPPGDVYQWLLEGSSYGRLALKTADGGVLVLYAMYLNSTVETRSALNQDVPMLSGPPITVPGFIRPLLPPAKWNPRTRLQSQDILSFAAIDPPASAKAAKVQVIAIGGGLHTAQAR